MTIQTGVSRQLGIKKESTWNTLAGTGSAQLLRRVQSTLNLSKNTYTSNEMRSDYQISDYRHGTRKVQGNISGELSGGTYQLFEEAALRRTSTAVSAVTGLTLTIGAAVSGVYPVTATVGNFSTLTVGMVILPTAGLAAGNRKNMMVVSYTSATVIGVVPLVGALTPEGPTASSTITVPGKYNIVPTSGLNNDSFTIEQWDPDVTSSERFTGCKISQLAYKMPATGMATADFGIMGGDLATSTAQYFSSPAANTTSTVFAAVNGLLRVNNTATTVVTGLDLTIAGGHTTGEVVGSNTTPDVFPGRVNVSGQFTAYFDGGTLRDLFIAETEIDLFVVLTADTTSTANFKSVYLPRIKLGSATKDDGEKGLVQTISFQAMLKAAATGYSNTTIQLQDSLYT